MPHRDLPEHGRCEVARAFDWGDDGGRWFDAASITCTVRGPAFAAAFAALDEARRWVPGSAAATTALQHCRRSLWRFDLALAAFLLVLNALSGLVTG